MPKFSLVNDISSSPKGEPCTEDVPALFGLPKPIVVLQIIIEGLSVLFLAVSIEL